MKKYTFAIAVAAVVAMSSCSETSTKQTAGTADTAVLKADSQVTTAERVATNWDKVDFTSPIVKYKEVTSKYVDVRSTTTYSIYAVDEAVLFASGKSDIQPDAKASLGEVCTSIAQHYPEGNIRVYGYADSVGTSADNKQLSMQRAEAVKSYLMSNCNLPAEKVSVVAEGENKPVASNDDAKGRQQNRRVRIVAMAK